jgi:hypothetical protein
MGSLQKLQGLQVATTEIMEINWRGQLFLVKRILKQF